jgi:tetratricopeptide (TPR) repeat protein
MPAVADTMLLAAIEHQRAGRLAEAEALYRSVVATEPGHGQALYLYGLLLLNSGRSHDAAATLWLAAAARPGHAATSIYLARALLADGQAAKALPVTVRLLAAQPDHPEAAFLHGTALNALGEPALAIVSFERALLHDPCHAAACLNLGNAYADIDQWDDAERYCREAIRLAPDLAEAHASLGFILTSRGRLGEAVAACEAAIALRPDFTQAHWNQAVAALLAGDFDLGFRKYEWRKRHDRFRRDFVDLPGPQWDGGDPHGRTILVHAEQGLGDTIQFARYLPLIAARDARVVLACERPLIPLLAQLPGVCVVPKDRPLPRFDCWIDQMSLPLACGTRLDTIPSAGGYLRVDPALTAAWREMLPSGAKVGLAWAGNPAHSNDRRRSMPPEVLQRIMDVPGVHMVNLRVGARASEIGLPDLSLRLTDYAETAALIEALDLVVAVDTSVVHVAGALGKPAWVMLPHAPDWRWLLGRDDSPWYSSLRLFRQPVPGDWDTVIAEVVAALARFG